MITNGVHRSSRSIPSLLCMEPPTWTSHRDRCCAVHLALGSTASGTLEPRRHPYGLSPSNPTESLSTHLFERALVSFQPSKEALQLHPDERSRLEAPKIANEAFEPIDISWPGARSSEPSAASSGASSSTSRASCASRRARTCVWNATESWKGQGRLRSTPCAPAPRSERLLRRTFRVVARCVPPPPPHRRSFLPWRRSARACS